MKEGRKEGEGGGLDPPSLSLSLCSFVHSPSPSSFPHQYYKWILRMMEQPVPPPPPWEGRKGRKEKKGGRKGRKMEEGKKMRDGKKV
jgi:hypothetical protein